MSQILMLQSILRAWRAGEAGRMFEAGRRYSDAPTAGISLGPVDTAVLARLVSEGFARDDATTVSLTGEPVAPGGFVRGGAPLGPARPALTPDGILISPVDSGRPAAGVSFVPMTYVWQLAASCATAATVTVSRTLNGVTAVIGTISVPAGGTGVDAYEREYSATYTWSSPMAGVTVEVL